MNATVTLPIGDLDKLRDDLKQAHNRVKELEINEREVRIKVIKTAVIGYDYRTGNPNNFFSVVESYVAMDDVLEPLRRKIQQEEEEKINGLIKEVKQYKDLHEITLQKLHQLQDTFNKKEVKESEESLRIRLNNADTTIKALSSDITKANDQIRFAQNQLKKLNERNWWQRLLNKDV